MRREALIAREVFLDPAFEGGLEVLHGEGGFRLRVGEVEAKVPDSLGLLWGVAQIFWEEGVDLGEELG